MRNPGFAHLEVLLLSRPSKDCHCCAWNVSETRDSHTDSQRRNYSNSDSKFIIDSRAQHSGRQEVTIGALRILLLSWRSGASNGDYFGEHFCQHCAVRVSQGTATGWSLPTHAQRAELGFEALSNCRRHKPNRHRAAGAPVRAFSSSPLKGDIQFCIIVPFDSLHSFTALS